MKVSFVGSGNVATQLAKACSAKGITVVDIYSKSINNANLLAELVNAKAVSNLNDLTTDIDLLIIAVSDNALLEIANKFEHFTASIVHTSGSTNIDVLKSDNYDYGVIYPLQTISKSKEIDFKDVPFFIEASNPDLKLALSIFCEMLGSKNVQYADSALRMKLHIAAVFACNFSNHMYAIAEELMRKNALDFELLKPLIAETAQKIQSMSPKSAQTGPASRNDTLTLEKHLQALHSEKALFDLYKAISEDIAKIQNS